MGNLLDITAGVICQQVNCKGAMGAGLALEIRNRYPAVYESYRRNFKLGLLKLGMVFVVRVTPELSVANMCCQDGFGRNWQHTDYEALRTCLIKLRGRRLYIPRNIGCGLGGGNWAVVSDIIRNTVPDAVIV